MKSILQFLAAACVFIAAPLVADEQKKMSGNPVFDGWYANPEGVIFGDTYWIYPTYSAPYDEQVFFDCFSSKDLLTWRKHSKWAKRAMWAPSVVEKDGKYYFFFGANDIQSDKRAIHVPARASTDVI
jgi:beta-xylosidase